MFRVKLHLVTSEGGCMKKLTCLLTAFLLTVCMFAACGDTNEPSSPGPSTSVPPSIYNPLTGFEKDENYPEGQRPAAVMVGNYVTDLPQSGLSSADIVYEMVTEGGIPRIMALFTNYKTMPLVGPVRSTRDQFLQFALPHNAMLAHIGTSRYAKDMLNYYTYQTIDGIYLGAAAYYYDAERAKGKGSEFCWYTNWEMLGLGIAELGLDTAGEYLPVFNFQTPGEEKITPTGGFANTVSFSFSSVAHTSFTYDISTGLYMKSEYDQPQIDALTGGQLAFQNLFILSTDIALKPDGFCADFNFSSGVGYYISNGSWQKVDWEKDGATGNLRITVNGNEIKVNCGTSYVAFISKGYMAEIIIN